MQAQELLTLTEALIRRPSVTPDDAGCQEQLGSLLARQGFQVRPMPFGAVQNLWATHGSGAPLFLFAGHTDVVPAGDLDAWTSDPFTPSVRDGLLFGRGAADMKASLAAMIGACGQLTAEGHGGTLAVLLTSDEEGPAKDGTRAAIRALSAEGVRIDHCVVGEPSSTRRLGDVVRCGRRGSLNATLRVRGVQGHVAYPDLALNPIPLGITLLDRLLAIEWDNGNDYFPPTSFQVANLNSGTGATNVIPASLEAGCNLRFNTEQTAAGIQARINDALAGCPGDWQIDWDLSGEPFLTPRGELTDAVTRAIERHSGVMPELSTSGGTSDGRFIAPTGAQVVELGPCNASIHKVDEHVAVCDLETLQAIYTDTARALLGRP